jgi:hypothetical protein
MDRPQAQIEAGLRLEENWMAASEIGARGAEFEGLPKYANP